MRTTLPTVDALWQHQFSRTLIDQIKDLPTSARIVLGCSGGVDSMLLLHQLAALCPDRLHVVTIDHGLQSDGAVWCAQVLACCRQFGVSASHIRVTVGDGNIEAAARKARYQAFEQVLRHDDVLALAHHQDDQAETILLHLFKGAGLSGLVGMKPLIKRWFGLVEETGHIDTSDQTYYWIWRPLLSLSRSQIVQWVTQLGLPVVNDPMNEQPQFDRVWCRQELWPVVTQRFPQMSAAINRAGRLLQDAEHILDEVAQEDLRYCVDSSDQRLELDRLAQLSSARQRQLLSVWLKGDRAFRPSLALIDRLYRDVIDARQDAQPQLYWQGWHLTRFNHGLYRLNTTDWTRWQCQPTPTVTVFNTIHDCQYWALGQVCAEYSSIGLSMQLLGQSLQLVPRHGGEMLRRYARHQQSLKKQLHAAKIEPWLRSQVQLLRYNDCLLGVMTPAGFWLAEHEYCQASGWLPRLH